MDLFLYVKATKVLQNLFLIVLNKNKIEFLISNCNRKPNVLLPMKIALFDNRAANENFVIEYNSTNNDHINIRFRLNM